MDIPTDLRTSSTFNVKDLVSYHGYSAPDLEPFADPQTLAPQPPQFMLPLSPVTTCREEIKAILEDQIVFT